MLLLSLQFCLYVIAFVQVNNYKDAGFTTLIYNILSFDKMTKLQDLKISRKVDFNF